MPFRVRFFVFALLIVTAGARAVAQTHGGGAAAPTAPIKPVSTEAPVPAPAATARAVAKAITDARAQRKPRRAPQRDRDVQPAELRWQLVWPQAEERVTLAWPAQ
jgi:hypothetical protein